MKDKNVAGILALFFGGLGIHRFYLGQIGLGIVYLFFFWITWLIALIDAIVFFSMDEDEFNRKYNRASIRKQQQSYQGYNRNNRQESREERSRQRTQERERRTSRPDPRQTAQYQSRPTPRRDNPFKASGVQKFKDFDYEGAIRDFNKALEIAPKDVAIHFNLACTYSLTENADKAFFHLDKAVALGFDDFRRIKEHDALAFLRIQPQFDQFEANGFRLTPQLDAPKEDLLNSPQGDLLEQLKRLGDLREKGLLTEEEFVAQKKKLLD
ncbi:MAG: NINE protein [Saprospiraceae bacterium]|nr:NINE protein [Lewinella sp.]